MSGFMRVRRSGIGGIEKVYIPARKLVFNSVG
jgi:hypothetical protein